MADVSSSNTASKTAVRTAVWLGLFMLLAFGLRAYFGSEVGFDETTDRNLFTGNDPYYHWRTTTHVVETGQNLNFDTAFNYPEGNWNPNPPLWTWTTAPVASALDSMGVADPVGTALNIMVAVWGALLVVPVYLLGRTLWNRSAGLWAAFFIAISAPHIQRSVWGYADHDAISMFFITLAFLFLVKAFKAQNTTRFVADWRATGTVGKGLKAALAANRNALAFAGLAGVALTACAATWKGYPYAIAILAVAAGTQMVVDHLRRRDGLASFLVYATTVALATLLPYILVYQNFTNYLPHTVVPTLYVLFAILVTGLLLVPTRDLPSLLVLPAIAATGLVAVLVLIFVFPAVGADLFSGLGYFAQSKLYSTIAEAQRPSLGEVAANFGFFTFLLAFWGLGNLIRRTAKGEASATLVASWAAVGLFMTFAASRFISNAAPLFALLIGFGIAQILTRIGLADVKKRFASQHGQSLVGRSIRSVSGKSVAGVLFVALFLVLPNVWTGVDAGMPTEYEVENGLLVSGETNRVGAFGISFELKDNGWNEAMTALATQDAGMALEEKPAFIAWWDYGHWATGIGAHPTVADPFQSHYELSGRFLASDGEAEALSWLSIHLLVGDRRSNGDAFSPAVQTLLAAKAPALAAAPLDYGHYDESYAIFKDAVADPAAFFDDVQEATGKQIGYLGVDRRMFPFDDPQTGGVEAPSIFYAPVFLANKNPDDYMQTRYASGSTVLTVSRYGTDADGNSYTLAKPTYKDAAGNAWVEVNGYAYREGQTPLQGFNTDSGVPLFGAGESMTVTSKFYQTMYGKAFGGLTSQAPAGEGLAHFRLIHESTQASTQPGVEIRDVALLAYYSGVKVSGAVKDDTGAGIAGLQVAFADGTGARHGFTTTGADGTFTATAPFAVNNDLTLQVLSGGSVIFTDNATAYQFSRAQAVAGDALSGVQVTVARGSLSGRAFEDNNNDGAFDANDTAVAGATLQIGAIATSTGADGSYSFASLAPGLLNVQVTKAGYQNATQQTTLRSGGAATLDIAMTIAPSSAAITVLNTNGTALPSLPVQVAGPTTTTVFTNAQGVATASLKPGSYTLTVNTTRMEGGVSVPVKASGVLNVPIGGQPVAVTLNRQ
ncbi:MAG: STT3 domain-containing protein [Candidatus Thermoplasmatota archaeon]